ncbi:hypothetical protein LQ327_26685 [Actinomycetospora endophytica]|uniref:ATP/GTP-binding protein n=1 Tax=Actinomycetospora endophytica TaxID=2291215 RepID=A0ABS8PFC5_9PSEU|nr:hypothetical protein [Actinomycetospora endophytica]MCD2196962.1 hypothetical protein [Actinomycetospora endophytica]
MARRNRRAAGGEPRPLFGGALSYVERAGRRWAVRSISGSAAAKTYRCPGCNQEIRPGVSHVVAWPVDGPDGGGDERRHWHTGCWQR